MLEGALIDELAKQLGSRREAGWIVEAASRERSEAATAVAAREMAARRAGGEPLQYVLESWPFRELELKVDSRALIPRPETEQLVQAVLDRWRVGRPGQGRLVIVDLGCGTGAIGLSLLHELKQEAVLEELVLTDRSREALALALENVVALGAERVSLAVGSWFEALDPRFKGVIDLLVSNPPYVAMRDRPSLAEELYYEPAEALFALDGAEGVPGFADVAQVIKGARPWMAPEGLLGVEMAEHQVELALALARDLGFEAVEAVIDLAGKPRGITALAP